MLNSMGRQGFMWLHTSLLCCINSYGYLRATPFLLPSHATHTSLPNLLGCALLRGDDAAQPFRLWSVVLLFPICCTPRSSSNTAIILIESLFEPSYGNVVLEPSRAHFCFNISSPCVSLGSTDQYNPVSVCAEIELNRKRLCAPVKNL